MILAFVPARLNSKSIPLKNIKNFCGKPLIYWVLKSLSEVKKVDEIYLATDSSIIEKIVYGLNIKKVKVYRREKKNALDTSTTESVMLEFINKKKIKNNDIFLLAQPTSPLTETSDYNKAILLYKKNRNKDSLISCSKFKGFLWNSKGESINYDYKLRPLRQSFKGHYLENGAIYINRVKNIIKFKNRICRKISIFKMNVKKSIDLDNYADWEHAEYLMHSRLKKKLKKINR